jgi:hypothetical protein
MSRKPKLFRVDYGWAKFWRVSPMPKPYPLAVQTAWIRAHEYATALNNRERQRIESVRAVRRHAARLARTYA